MDSIGGDSNYGLKLLLGTIIGVIILLFLGPLGANIIASQEVSSAANDAFNAVDSQHGTPQLIIPINATSFIGIIDVNITDNSSNNYTNIINEMQNNSTHNNTNNTNNTINNNTIINNTDNNDTNTIPVNENNNTENTAPVEKATSDVSNMKILSGTISTGSGTKDKSVCTVYVGSEFAGENVKMSTLYSRDGSNLNSGRLVSKTVDSSGYITLPAADSYELYPSNCIVTIYDSQGNELDSRSVSLEPSSGTQSF